MYSEPPNDIVPQEGEKSVNFFSFRILGKFMSP